MSLTLADLVLRLDGIGPLSFGATERDATERLTAILGPSESSVAVDYPVPVDSGLYARDEFAEEVFQHPSGRTVCYPNGLCVDFGGPAAGALTFVGWTQTDSPGALTTAEGVSVGSRWSDFLTAMTVGEGGCFREGSGTTDGVFLHLRSEGIPFVEVADDGSLIPQVPDPADVVVTMLESGDIPAMPGIDC